MSKSERRFASTVNKPSSKPSPFSSLLSLKKRRMPGDTSVIDVTSDSSHTDHPPILIGDLASLPLLNTDATEQPLLPSIQPPQTPSASEQPVPSDIRLHRESGAGEHSDEPSIRAGVSPAHPVSPDLQTFEQPKDVRPHQTVGDTTVTSSTSQVPSPPVQPHRTSGVISATNSNAVRLARDPLGKRSHPGYTRMTVYVQKQTHDDFKLVTDLAREEMSEVVEKLIGDYARQGRRISSEVLRVRTNSSAR